MKRKTNFLVAVLLTVTIVFSNCTSAQASYSISKDNTISASIGHTPNDPRFQFHGGGIAKIFWDWIFNIIP